MGFGKRFAIDSSGLDERSGMALDELAERERMLGEQRRQSVQRDQQE
jgi:hypothetical protein